MERAPITATEILRDPMLWLIAVTVAIVTAGMKGMITNLAPLVVDAGLPAARAALLVSTYSACSFMAKISFAALADRLGPRPLMALALAGFATGMICMTQAGGGFAVIALGVGLTGIFGGFMIPMESYLAPRVFGQRGVGKAMGILSGVVLIAMLSTPPLFGLIHDLTGSYTAMFWVFAGMALTALLWVKAIRLHPRPAA